MKKIEVPYLKQKYDFDCGATSCRMLLKYFFPDKQWNHDDMMYDCKTTKAGTYFSDVLKVLRDEGLELKRLRSRKNIKESLDLNRPVALSYIDHIAVIISYDDCREVFIINDPWYGKNYKFPYKALSQIKHSAYKVDRDG